MTASITDIVTTLPFAEALGRLVQAITGAQMTIFARIDHAAGARAAGLSMPETTVLLYGNPKGGTPIMLAAPQAALDLPLRVLVREDPAKGVVVSFHPAAAMLAEAGVPAELAARLEPAQHVLVRALAG
jgi:uncharacterized protein (DUF302 family)